VTPLLIVVRGKPEPQGSKSPHSICYQDAVFCRRCGHKHLVKINTREAVKGLPAWRKAVTAEAHNVMVRTGLVAITGPVVVAATFTMARPKNHYRTGKSTAHLLTTAAPAFPEAKPDASKLARAIEDSLTDAGVWADDAQVVDYVRCAKVYPQPGMVLPALVDPVALSGIPGADALESPGVVIRITRPRDWEAETLDLDVHGVHA
jgi:Holliday junction resolvase RusA-like endonuclease